jgi:hypothetical protein
VAQDQDLDLVCGVGSGAQHHPAHQLGEHQVDQPKRHRRIMPASRRRPSSRSPAARTVSGTHARRAGACRRCPADTRYLVHDGLPVASSENHRFTSFAQVRRLDRHRPCGVREGQLQRRDLHKREDRWYFSVYYREALLRRLRSRLTSTVTSPWPPRRCVGESPRRLAGISHDHRVRTHQERR